MKNALILASVASMIKQFNIDNIKILSELGYKVHVICNFNASGTIDKSDSLNLKKELVDMGVVIYDIEISRNPFSINNIKSYKKIKKAIAANEFEIIHSHSPVGGVLARLAARKFNNCLSIYTAHGFHFYRGAPLRNWLLYYPVELFFSRYTDILITINNEDYVLAKKKFKKAKKIVYVPGTGVDVRGKKIKNRELNRESLNLKEEDHILIFGAELNKNKNQKLLIDTMELLVEEKNNIKLLLVGRDNNNGEYQKYVEKKSLTENVKFMGYRTDLQDLIELSDIAVSSSIREGLGIFVVEAMTQGLPIVSSNNRGSRELVKQGINGYLITDKFEMCSKINEILDNKILYKSFSENSKELSMKFSKENVNKTMREIYGGI